MRASELRQELLRELFVNDSHDESSGVHALVLPDRYLVVTLGIDVWYSSCDEKMSFSKTHLFLTFKTLGTAGKCIILCFGLLRWLDAMCHAQYEVTKTKDIENTFYLPV